MAEKSLFTLTADTVQGWRDERARLEADIAKKNAQLAAVNDKLRAAAILTEQAGVAPDEATDSEEPDGQNMTEAVAHIANSSVTPLSPGLIKQRLRALGFPESRLANYYYTVISRLKAKGKISVTDDGKLWKAQL